MGHTQLEVGKGGQHILLQDHVKDTSPRPHSRTHMDTAANKQTHHMTCETCASLGMADPQGYSGLMPRDGQLRA